MLKNELVTVIIPTYNRAKRIKDSVESVLNQTYSNIELIVVDDGSTDDTKAVLAHINDHRLKVIYQKNAGACAARNNGIIHAHGTYIAFNDSDDTWRKDKLQKQVTALIKNNVDLVFCKMLDTDKNVTIPAKHFKSGIIYPVDDVVGISTQTMLAKANVFKDNLFDSTVPRLQDIDVLIRLALSSKYSFYCIDEPLVNYKVWSDSISNDPRKLEIALKIFSEKYPKLNVDLPKVYSDLSNIAFDVGKEYLKNGDKLNAEKALNLTLIYGNRTFVAKYLKILRNKFLVLNIKIIKKIKG